MDERLDRNFLEGELHEKIIVRERRRRRILIGVTLTLFLVLSAVPVYQERLPKWESLDAARRLAVEIERLKTDSIRLKKPLKLTLFESGEVKVDVVNDCEAGAPAGQETVGESLRTENWKNGNNTLSMLPVDQARKLNLNLVVDQLCFDPVNGLSQSKTKKVLVILPVKDLAESRLDRASYVEVETPTARISIN